ncbi:MAG TPA: Hsp20/alpha crystallin family protein [Anaerolineales bacterium]|nr:Hsp20/alpha crystallin family protein [Anaerolineales bacterium]
MNFYAYPFPHRMARRWLAAAENSQSARFLAVNIRDENEAFVLTALVPGMKAEDVKIQVLEDVVRIEGDFPRDENEYLLQELPNGSFRRELRLPSELDADKVEAKIADGVLTLRLPKAESARPKTIKVASK